MEAATTPLPLPLQRYRLFESHDMDEARESVARVFCPHKLVMVRPRTELDACHHSARLHRDVSLNYVQYGPGVQIDPGYLQDFFLLQGVFLFIVIGVLLSNFVIDIVYVLVDPRTRTGMQGSTA